MGGGGGTRDCHPFHIFSMSAQVMGDDILEERFNFDPSGFYADLGICAGQAMLYLFFAFLCLTFLQKETR